MYNVCYISKDCNFIMYIVLCVSKSFQLYMYIVLYVSKRLQLYYVQYVLYLYIENIANLLSTLCYIYILISKKKVCYIYQKFATLYTVYRSFDMAHETLILLCWVYVVKIAALSMMF